MAALEGKAIGIRTENRAAAERQAYPHSMAQANLPRLDDEVYHGEAATVQKASYYQKETKRLR